jgi:hypothetical protein
LADFGLLDSSKLLRDAEELLHLSIILGPDLLEWWT